MAPFLAHKELGDTYKWMLYGDDDTHFFLDGALRLAQDFDPDLPWFITGSMCPLLFVAFPMTVCS